MFCLWKTHHNSPCACAFKLHAGAPEILPQLARFGTGTLVLRQCGLSLSSQADLRSLVRFPRRAGEPVRWPVEHLEMDDGGTREFYLFIGSGDPRPQLASAKRGGKIDFSIHLHHHVWDSPEVRGLIETCGGAGVSCELARELGAGAWLDEWPDSGAGHRDDTLSLHARRQIESSSLLEVRIQAEGIRGDACFEPSFIDVDGSILRIADKRCRHVVFADADSPGFRLVRRNGNTVSISQLPSAA
jgi:hypothetical protein